MIWVVDGNSLRFLGGKPQGGLLRRLLGFWGFVDVGCNALKMKIELLQLLLAKAGAGRQNQFGKVH